MIVRIICFICIYFCGIVFSDETKNAYIDSDAMTMAIQDNQFLFGDIHLLSTDAPESVKRVSGELFSKTGFRVIVNIIDNMPNNNNHDTQVSSPKDQFNIRREYESAFIDKIHGNYAVVFLFYKEHAITIRTNIDFINTQDLLENYAYPYLPAESIGSDKYKNGVNEGLSNVYLALSHAIADHYNVTLNAPKPMEKPNEATKVIIYAMLIVLIVLFLLVSNGFFKKRAA